MHVFVSNPQRRHRTRPPCDYASKAYYRREEPLGAFVNTENTNTPRLPPHQSAQTTHVNAKGYNPDLGAPEAP